MSASNPRATWTVVDPAVATLFLSAAAAAFFVPLLTGPTDMPGDIDTLFNMYILEHVTRWLEGNVPSLASPGFYWPYPLTFAFSDTHLLSVPFYALPRWFGLTPEGAFKVWFVAGYSLTFLAAFIALRLMGLLSFLAGLGAFAFAFSLPSLAQIMHAQLGWAIGVPFAFLFMSRYARPQGQPANLLAFIAAISVQIILNVYLGLYALLLCAIMFICALAFAYGRDYRGWAKRLFAVPLDLRRSGGAGVGLVALTSVAVLACIALLSFHAYVAFVYGFGRGWGEIAPMVPRWQSYLMMDALPYWAPLSGSLPDLPARHEHQLFVGVPLAALFLASLAALKREQGETKILIVTTLAASLLFLSVAGFSIYYLVTFLPGFGALRAATRFELVAVFPICAVGMLTLQRMCRRSRSGYAVVLIAAIWTIADVALFERVEYDSSAERARIEALASRIEALGPVAGAVLADGKGDSADGRTYRQMLAMWAALDAGMPTLNGYSGNYPPGGGNDNCSWFIHQLARYDEWARDRGRTRLADLNYDVIPVDLRPCDLTAKSVLDRDAAHLPASLLDDDVIANSRANPQDSAGRLLTGLPE
ncbi:MAG: hypothetical protein H6883_07600 [Rhodobiaceae bacterium]|nr:hypothetical protein [Rhodobiaceae bacterium]MCC0055985.1 hypothetical protein [Rhodobiaceae bacterium]